MKLFEVLHDGASRPIIQTPSGRWLSLSQFEKGRWVSYEDGERDCAVIVETLNFVLANSPEMIAMWNAVEIEWPNPSVAKGSE